MWFSRTRGEGGGGGALVHFFPFFYTEGSYHDSTFLNQFVLLLFLENAVYDGLARISLSTDSCPRNLNVKLVLWLVSSSQLMDFFFNVCVCSFSLLPSLFFEG